ncbi:hypothetical protein L6R52_44135 [Myxococcota bacterium]|nr:hypothetical protein [Myxococcota bacterium]
MRRREVREFRASWIIRAAVLAALVLWLAVGVAAIAVGPLPSYAIVSIAFFVLFFLVFVTYYFSMAVVVHEYGVTCRGATEFEHFDWEDIVHIRGLGVPLGGYYVATKTGGFALSSFLQSHEALVELIAARAGLMPERA